jgi:hypothetical protein
MKKESNIKPTNAVKPPPPPSPPPLGPYPLTYDGTPHEIENRRTLAMSAIVNEYYKAANRFGPFHSAHEGIAVIKEELDELWDEIKKNPESRSPEKMLEEAAQLGAMAKRFIVDICLPEIARKNEGDE